ncbi:MAG: NAD(P)-dependent oxidoreductase [Gemmatimonadota bacterium]|jgi:precorrin-2 dehydrogenase/sirohydrochlorin ferrochelatase
MRFLPVGLDIRNRDCLVVGGGPVGTRKAMTLARAGAHVTVVSPEVSSELAGEIGAGRIRWLKERFRAEHLAGAFLAVLATDDPDLNAAAARLATQQGALTCDASSAGGSQIIFGALLERDDVTVATFTDGRSPGRARQLRDAIAGLLAEKEAAQSEPVECKTLLVLVAHGSRNQRWGIPLEALTASIREQISGCAVQLAYAQFASPGVQDVVAEAVRAGVHKICMLPLFMTAEGHVDRDIRPMVADLQRTYPAIEVALLPPVGQHAQFQQVLVDIAKETTA